MKSRCISRPVGRSASVCLGAVVLVYDKCVSEVIGPIDARQAEPFAELLREHCAWRVRRAQIEIMASRAEGALDALYGQAISAISELLSKIERYLSPSFQAQLSWETPKSRRSFGYWGA